MTMDKLITYIRWKQQQQQQQKKTKKKQKKKTNIARTEKNPLFDRSFQNLIRNLSAYSF